jgi:uncharacterized membrane protein
MESSEVYAGAALLGAMAGMRSMSAPAVLGKISRNGGLEGSSGPLAFIHHAGFLPVSGALAVGELIADKLPFVPNRTAAGPLLGRALMGAFSGAAVCAARKRPWLIGALLGGGAAVGAAYGAYQLRKRIGEKLKVSDPLIALGEDVIVGGLGAALTAHFSSPLELNA